MIVRTIMGNHIRIGSQRFISGNTTYINFFANGYISRYHLISLLGYLNL